MYNNLNPVIVSSSSSSVVTTSSTSSSAPSTSSTVSTPTSVTSVTSTSSALGSTSSSASSSDSSSSSVTSSSAATTASTSSSAPATTSTTSSSVTSATGAVCSSPSALAPVATPNPARRSFTWSVGWVRAAPDGFARPFVGINGQWPNPTISVNRGDTVVLTVTNNLGNESTAIHFHGLRQINTTYADGPSMVTQCPIQPGGTFVYQFIVDQPGTYWYHAHIGGQYIDGFRGPLIVKDVNAPYRVDTEYVMTISDLYHSEAPPLINYYQSLGNANDNNGAEPVPNSLLINEAQNVQFPMVAGKKYLFRIINVGAFTPVYLQFDQHSMTIVEIDGVYTSQCTQDQLFITPAQRYSVIIQAKATGTQNFAIKASMSVGMFFPPLIPATFNTEVSAFLVYNSANGLPPPLTITPEPFDDSIFTPLDATPEFGPVTLPLSWAVDFTNNANGQRRGTINAVDYVAPKVPTLYTAMNAPAANVNDPTIYGTHTTPTVVPYNAVVEIFLENHDTNPHPFHLHGHNMQLVGRSGGGSMFPYNPPAGAAPMRRDTIQVPAGGSVTLRWVANNPGIQLFHCHLEWHVEAGLTATFIEAPTQLQALKLYIPVSHRTVCANQSIAMKGNAAGNTADYTNMNGQNTLVSANLWGSLVNPPSTPANPYPLN
ncbi:multicopper oxidase [Hyaloscypha bicolor E]|uniref:Multicopper oxidase n=1 Tax=Hyaloscypha bicolor E TaxID=1095630 RepID=A0A2J6SQU9_9HELO|nr:multicopper oxidase [Hyaloscypha bicolor E]PMD53154.1 multicopper oxidase [Hyaloscypha bicolor E]